MNEDDRRDLRFAWRRARDRGLVIVFLDLLWAGPYIVLARDTAGRIHQATGWTMSSALMAL